MTRGRMMRFAPRLLLMPAMISILSLAGAGAALSTPGEVLFHEKISQTAGGFGGVLDDVDAFTAPALIGDLDGDGVNDLAVGTGFDDDGGTNRGAVWILFLNADGTVKSEQKISDTAGNFTGVLDDSDFFGLRINALGDFDGDGIGDLGVSAQLDDDGGRDRGALWLLFLNSDGTVKSHQKISDTAGGFGGTLDDRDRFGISATALGDLDGDGLGDLAVGAYLDDDGGRNRGAVWILFLNADGTVKASQKISDTAGGFAGVLDDDDLFGVSVASLGDLDGDGVGDLAAGTNSDGDGGFQTGAVWILFLDTDGTVKSHQKISGTEGNLTGLSAGDQFGQAVDAIDDLNGDGITDLVVGAVSDPGGGDRRGAVWVLLLNTDGTVQSAQRISDDEGNFTGVLDDIDEFGDAVASLGDFNGDGITDIAVGSRKDDDGGLDRGAVWLLFLDGVPNLPAAFVLLDGDAIDTDTPAIETLANMLGVDPASLVNDSIADKGVRAALPIPVGTVMDLPAGEVGDEGWFVLKESSILPSWDAAGPTADGLQNYLVPGPGLGSGNDPEALLDEIPDVTPLRSAGLDLLPDRTVCALVYKSDISINYGPLEGNLQGANRGLIGFDVVAIGPPSGSSELPELTVEIVDVAESCDEELTLLEGAPAPISSSEPPE